MQFSLPWPPAADKCQSQMELRSRADLWGEYFRSLLLNIAVTQTALRNLVSYLKQKEAAGVISLQNRWGGRWDNIWLLLRFMFFFFRETEQSGVLYAFPPCAFSMDLLRRSSFVYLWYGNNKYSSWSLDHRTSPQGGWKPFWWGK